MIETLTDQTILTKQISNLVANGLQHPYPNSIFEQPHVIVRQIIDENGIDQRHPFKRKIGHNFSVLIAKSREKASLDELMPTITRLKRYL